MDDSTSPCAVVGDDVSAERGDPQNAFLAEIQEIFDGIEVGPEPFLSQISELSVAFSENPGSEFRTKWNDFLRYLYRNPNYGLRSTILQFFTISRKLRLFASRLYAVIPLLPRAQSTLAYYSRIMDIMVGIFQNTHTDCGHIMFFINCIDDILQTKDFDVIAHHALAYIRLDEFEKNLKKLRDILIVYRDTLAFITSLNQLISAFNKLYEENNFTIRPVVIINIVSPYLEFNNTVQGSVNLNTIEKSYINSLIDSLFDEGIVVSKDDGVSFKIDSLESPDLSPIFKSLYQALNQCDSSLSESLRDLISKLSKEPTTELLVFEALSELTYLKAGNDLNLKGNESIDTLFHCVHVLHTTYVLLTMLDFCGIALFGNTIRLTYARSFCNYILGKDLLCIPLALPIEPSYFKKICMDVQVAGICSPIINFKQKRNNLRKFFSSILSFIDANFAEQLSPLLSFLFEIETGELEPLKIKRVISIISNKLATQHNECLNDFYRGVNEILDQMYSQKDKTYQQDFLSDFILGGGIGECDSPSFPSDLIPIFSEVVNTCIHDGLISVVPGTDIDFNVDSSSEFVAKFMDFNASFLINDEELSRNAFQMRNAVILASNKRAPEIIFCVDMMSRGSLGSQSLVRFLNSALSSGIREAINVANAYINLWRFFLLRDELASSIAINTHQPNLKIDFSILRHFNMRSFLSIFSKIVMFLVIACDVPQIPSTSYIEQCLELKNAANAIPLYSQADQGIVTTIDNAFSKVRIILSSLKIGNVVAKVKAVLNELSAKYMVSGREKIFILIDQLVAQNHFDPNLSTEIIARAQESFSQVGQNPHKCLEELISYLNTIFMYQHLNDDIYSFYQFLINSSTYIFLTDPFLVVAHPPDATTVSIIPSQLGLAPSNPDFDKFLNVNQQTQLYSVLKDFDDINFDFIIPDYVIPLETQNQIANILKEEAHVEIRPDEKEGDNSPQDISVIKEKIVQAEKLNKQLANNLKKSKAKGREELKAITRKFTAAFNEFNYDNSMSHLEIGKLNSTLAPLSQIVERKRNILRSLRMQYSSLCEMKSSYMNEQEVLPNPEVNSRYPNLFSLPTPYQYEPSKSKIEDRVEEKASVDNEEEEEEEEERKEKVLPQIPLLPSNSFMEIKPKFVPTPEALRGIIGDEWPESTQREVESQVQSLENSINCDTRNFMLPLEEISSKELFDIVEKNKKNSSSALTFLELDLQRRLLVAQDVLKP